MKRGDRGYKKGTTERGFTLLEILVALAILGVALAAGQKAIFGTIDNQAYLKDKTIAQWVALNQIAELQLKTQETTAGEQSGTVEMARREWAWRIVVTPTPNDDQVMLLEATVSPVGMPEQVLIHQYAFLGKPG